MKQYTFHKDGISPDPKDCIFVFGSNEAGVHGAGAALEARKKFGAVLGVGYGLRGRSFAIPTKDYNIRTLPLPKIKLYVNQFMEYAHQYPELNFFVTRIGCGLAGYQDAEIAPMFHDAPANCVLPEDWEPFSF